MCLNKAQFKKYIQLCVVLLKAIEQMVNKEWIKYAPYWIVYGCWTYNWPLCVNCGPFMAPDLDTV